MKVIVTATIVSQSGLTHCLPTFYLNGNIQGFSTLKEAEVVAKEVIDPFNQYLRVYIDCRWC